MNGWMNEEWMNEQGILTQRSTCHENPIGIQVLRSAPVIASYLKAVLIWLKTCTTESGPHLSHRNETPEASHSQVPDPHSSTFPVGKKEFLHSCEDVPVFSGKKREHSGIEHGNVRHPWGPLPAATSWSLVNGFVLSAELQTQVNRERPCSQDLCVMLEMEPNSLPKCQSNASDAEL